MPLFGKKQDADSNDRTTPAADPSQAASDDDPGTNEEETLLSQYSEEGAGGGPSTDGPETQDTASEAVSLLQEGDGEREEDKPADESADGVGEDLLDIFTSEEVEDEDLKALTKDLEDIDVPSLLTQARQLSTQLRNRAAPR